MTAHPLPGSSGMARCHRCGTPAVPVFGAMTVAEAEAHPDVTVWCHDCAIAEEASRITAQAAIFDRLEDHDA